MIVPASWRPGTTRNDRDLEMLPHLGFSGASTVNALVIVKWMEDRITRQVSDEVSTLADLQIVEDGSGYGAYAMASKQVTSVGCPHWQDPQIYDGVAAYCYCSDQGADQKYMRRLIAEDIRHTAGSCTASLGLKQIN